MVDAEHHGVMERHKKEKKYRTKAPRVPIKTYKWEDVKRSRLKGGYPWTYLDKEPFKEQSKLKNPTMEAKSKSATPEKCTVKIEEISTTAKEPDTLVPGPSGYMVITEVPSDSESHSKEVPASSVTIEDIGEVETINLESAESSDDISQYLDKEEPEQEVEVSKNDETKRAKSEEPTTTRKRKLSIDSSYSRKSLSKLAIMKKLKEAKAKIHLPSLPNLGVLSNPLKQEKPSKTKSKGTKISSKPKEVAVRRQYEDIKPIHIPLKPPEGETDEFSYLEFGEKKPEEPKKEEETKSPEEETKTPEEAPKIEISEPFDESRRFSGDPNEIVAFEILKTETIDLDHASQNGLQGGSDYLFIEQDDDAKSESRSMIIIMPNEEDEASTSKKDEARKVRAKSAEPERKRKLSADSSYSRISLSKLAILKKLRDAKDKLTETLSFSKPDVKKAKKPKEEVEVKEPKVVPKTIETSKKNEPKYIHIPLKPPPGESDEFSHLEFEEKKELPKPTKEDSITEKQSSVESPVSEDVQFIFLTPPSDDEALGQAEIPETPSSENQKFFPSQIGELKEIAKDAVDSASPKSRKKLQAVEEEENVDSAQHSAEEEVIEEEEEKKSSKKEKAKTTKEEVAEKMIVDEEDGLKSTESAMGKQEQNVKVKEVVETAQELKSSIKIDGSPLLKKKVSFKRRSRDDSKDGEYEDVQAPKDDKAAVNKTADEQKSKLEIMETGQSMSVDEEKSYLDEQKIIKATSLEEDYNRWSKLSDHDYEPINPPPDNTTPQPTVHVMDTERKALTLTSSSTSLERRMQATETETTPTAQDLQTEIENKYFYKPKPQPTVHTITTVTTTTTSEESAKPPGPGKFRQAFKNQTDKFKMKLHEIKKPNIKLPSKPTIKKPNFEKMKINLPKIPDTTKITLPSFSLPRKSPVKRSLKERQFSTESNAGGSKKNYFDFRTYPRLFKKKPKEEIESKGEPIFATVPRTKKNKDGGSDSIRIRLKPEDSVDDPEREDSVERRMASQVRYEGDLDFDDAYEKENQEIHAASPFSHDYNSRWNHGSFHPQEDQEVEARKNEQVTDLDSPDDPPPRGVFQVNKNIDIHSSESSLGIHHRGVLEEIDSDEFFLRQKGISQDNIEVGMYLSSEIREAFKSPSNALADLELRSSNQSLPETPSKKRSTKKQKRKKTPHVSHEQISFDQDSELDNDFPPSRPKRRSRRNKKKEVENVIPYQETLEDEVPVVQDLQVQEQFMYENEQMQGREQPEIKLVDPYYDFKTSYDSEEELFKEEPKPEAPPRKHKSLKSLDYSEHDSILGDVDPDRQPLTDHPQPYKPDHEYIIPTPEMPPTKPPRTLSRSSSKSQGADEDDTVEIPLRPSRTRSRSHTDSLFTEEPCVEEICVEDIRDCMGYAVIDKNVRRDPPLPPPRRSTSSEQKFFTVPRNGIEETMPVRPMRNYSTLGPSRPPRRKQPVNMTDEEKGSIDITQYIEIEEEPNRDLVSGEVIQKMKDRPLPAPPRPPRKGRSPVENGDEERVEEVEMSTQTDEFEDVTVEEEVTEKRLLTPTHYTYGEETVTHGSLVIEPLNGARILPDSELTKVEKPIERSVPITKEYDDETSEIPEEFTKLKDPEPQHQPSVIERIIERPVLLQPDSTSEVEVLKAHKLQVTDLDVDRLSVNELMASKIIVSEIDSGNIQANEISSRSGALKVGEIELPPGLVQQLFEKLQSVVAQEQHDPPKDEPEQKKTPIEQVTENPTRRIDYLVESENISLETPLNISEIEEINDIPEPPPRTTSSEETPQRPPRHLEKQPDDEPPPRPPEPYYVPSQPPESFYALRAQQLIDEEERDIPMVPRRRRHHKHRVERSSSDESPPPAPSRRRHKTPERSIPELTGQLIQACGVAANSSIKRLIAHISNNVLRNADGQQDSHVIIIILLVLVAGLILLGFGDERTVHYHHWEFFNPPRDM